MTELKEEHFEVIDANRARDHKKKTYTPLSHDLFIEESMIEGQGLFSSHDLPKGTDLGVSHIELEKDKMAAIEIVRTPLGGFVNHKPIINLKDENDGSLNVEVSGPNCEKIRQRTDGAKTEWRLVTRKDVKAGEELTLEYSMYIPVK